MNARPQIVTIAIAMLSLIPSSAAHSGKQLALVLLGFNHQIDFGCFSDQPQ